MIPTALKRLASKIPMSWQWELRRRLHRRQILRNQFITDEPEYALLNSLLAPGDWAIDVGANIGHYTKRMSDLVAESGRVITFEPVGHTFSLLAANVQHFQYQNVTLLNVAASDQIGVMGISIPHFAGGMNNYYEATLTENGGGLKVMTLPIDSLCLSNPVKLVKIDVEGHELSVLKGMNQLLTRDRPTLIVEVSSQDVHSHLADIGYRRETLEGSPNHIYRA